MAILAETYSAPFVLKHLEGKRMELQKDQQMMKSKIDSANEDVRYEDRIVKINNVLSTNPKYIEKYELLQELIKEGTALRDRISKITEAITNLRERQSEEQFKGQFEETLIHLSLSDRITYGLEEGSDLHAV